MKRIVAIASGFFVACMFVYLICVGWYQAVQLTDFVPHGREYVTLCRDTPGWHGSQCEIYAERFGAIAFGIIIALLLFPALPIFLESTRILKSRNYRVIACLITFALIVIVHFSGVLTYYLLK